MRQLIVSEFISLDGVIDSPGGNDGYRNAGWTINGIEFDPAAYELKGREQEEAGVLLFGRRTYEIFAPVWPSMDIFERYNSLPKYVVSTTLESVDPGWPATILRSLEDVAALKESDGDPILVQGSGMLSASMADAGLIDRYHLLVFPVLLGSGRRLFSESDNPTQHLKLVEHEIYPNGIQKQVFDVVHDATQSTD